MYYTSDKITCFRKLPEERGTCVVGSPSTPTKPPCRAPPSPTSKPPNRPPPSPTSKSSEVALEEVESEVTMFSPPVSRSYKVVPSSQVRSKSMLSYFKHLSITYILLARDCYFWPCEAALLSYSTPGIMSFSLDWLELASMNLHQGGAGELHLTLSLR